MFRITNIFATNGFLFPLLRRGVEGGLLLALVAVTLLSCSNDSDSPFSVSSSPVTLPGSKPTFIISVANLPCNDNGSAVSFKTQWEVGDELKIWYDDNTQHVPDAVLCYDGSKWSLNTSANVSGNNPTKSAGRIKVLFDGCQYAVSSTNYIYDSSTKSLTADITNWTYLTEFQVEINWDYPSLPADSVCLSSNMMYVLTGYRVTEDGIVAEMDNPGTSSAATFVDNEDGTKRAVFMFAKPLEYDKPLNHIFTLSAKSADSDTLQFDYVLHNLTIANNPNNIAGTLLSLTPFISYGKASILALYSATVEWTRLWTEGPKFAVENLYNAKNPLDYLTTIKWYSWGGHINLNISETAHSVWYTGLGSLKGEDDSATRLWGENWRMPTANEMDSLFIMCDARLDAVKGVAGYTFTGRGTYARNSIFLPAEGMYRNMPASFDSEAAKADDDADDLDGASVAKGFYWTSTNHSEYMARRLIFDTRNETKPNYVVDQYYKSMGYTIRPVLAK